MPEYPGYGIYKRTCVRRNLVSPSAEQILEDALLIFNYFTTADHMGQQRNSAGDVIFDS